MYRSMTVSFLICQWQDVPDLFGTFGIMCAYLFIFNMLFVSLPKSLHIIAYITIAFTLLEKTSRISRWGNAYRCYHHFFSCIDQQRFMCCVCLTWESNHLHRGKNCGGPWLRIFTVFCHWLAEPLCWKSNNKRRAVNSSDLSGINCNTWLEIESV